MEQIKKDYEEIIKERNQIKENINILNNNPIIQEYIELQKKDIKLKEKEKELYYNLKHHEFATCNHLSVITSTDRDDVEARSYEYSMCIKCGLNENIINRSYRELVGDDIIMFNFFHQNDIYSLWGKRTNIICNEDLAIAIYSKIKEHYPNIDDDTALKYFKAALYNIRKKEVNESREQSRAKRLSLNPNFNIWGRLY